MSYRRAKDVVMKGCVPSVAHLHRELGCGYKLAAEFLARMEKEAIVSPITNGQRFVVRKVQKMS